MDRELSEYIRSMTMVVMSSADTILKLADMTDIDGPGRKINLTMCADKIIVFAKEIKRIARKI